MQINLLKTIVASVAGNAASGIVDLLYGKKNVNEFLISKKLKLTINQTRNILYKLADEGLVSFVRKKDNKKGGWYTYYWTLNSGKSLIKFRDNLTKSIEQIDEQINSRKSSRFFYCKECNIEYSEEAALTNNYTCPECGSVLEIKDNAVEISQLEKDREKIKTALDKINEEVDIINTQEEKARARKIRAEERKRIKEKETRKKELLKNRALLKKGEKGKKGKVKKPASHKKR